MSKKMSAILQYVCLSVLLVIHGGMTQVTYPITTRPTPPPSSTTTSTPHYPTTTNVSAPVISVTSTMLSATTSDSQGSLTGSTEPMSTGAIVGIVLAVLFLLVVLTVIGGLLIYRKCYKMKQQSYIESMNPVTYSDCEERTAFETSPVDNSCAPNPTPEISSPVYINVESGSRKKTNGSDRKRKKKKTTSALSPKLSKDVAVHSPNDVNIDGIDVVYDVPKKKVKQVAAESSPLGPDGAANNNADKDGGPDVLKQDHKRTSVDSLSSQNEVNIDEIDVVYDVPKNKLNQVTAEPSPLKTDVAANNNADKDGGRHVLKQEHKRTSVESFSSQPDGNISATNNGNNTEGDNAIYDVPGKQIRPVTTKSPPESPYENV